MTAFQAALTLSALAGLWPLLRTCYGPAWPLPEEAERMPSGAQDEDDDDILDF